MINRKLKLLLLSVLMISQVLFASADAEAASTETRYLEETMNFVREKYIEEIPREELTMSMLQGMFNRLDDYSRFFTVSEAEAYLSDIEGIYAGIGAVMIEYGDFIVIYELLPDSPAEKAGLLPGDIITAVDGVSCVGFSLETAIDMIKGSEGTKVVLQIWRKDLKQVFEAEITRAVLKLNPIKHYRIGDIGYISIASFNDNVEEYFLAALDELKQANISKLILDLRENPGGDAAQAVAVARELVPQGLITRLDFKSESTEDIAFYSELKRTRYKLAVLVNGMSASASEILAGAIQDTAAGTLIGTTTYGKSKVQNIFPLLTPTAFEKYELKYGVQTVNAFDVLNITDEDLSDEDIIGWAKITTGEYFTPLGRRIDKVGLTPDIYVGDYSAVKGIDVHDIDKLRAKVSIQPGGESIDVINAEYILTLLDYKLNSPDLSLDSITTAAIKQYQEEEKLAVTGILDIKTQKSLNNKLDELVLKIDKQLAKAVEVLK